MKLSTGGNGGNPDFGALLRRHIQASLYTYGQLAKLSGVPKRTIVNWVDGTTQFPRHWQSVIRVATALRLSRAETDELLNAAGLPDLQTLDESVDAPADRHLFTPWSPEVHSPVGQSHTSLRAYLEAMARELERLPTYFPRHAAFTFATIYQDRHMRRIEAGMLPKDGTAFMQGHEGDSWSLVRAKHARVVILGQPGMGKSWLLKAEAMRVATDALQQDAPFVLPVLVRVPELAALLQGQSGLQAILHTVAELAAATAPRLPEAELTAALYTQMQAHTDRVVFLLDALDEVPERDGLRTVARRAIIQLGAATRARIVLTSRVLGYAVAPVGRYLGKDVAEYEVMPFTNHEIAHVMRVWFHGQPDKLELLARGLRRAPALARQATNPLLLSMMCMLTETHGAQLTDNRTSLYEPVLRLLLEGHWRNFDMQLPESRVRAKLRVLEVIAWCFATYRQSWWEQLPGDVLEQQLEGLPEAQRLWSTWRTEWGTIYDGPLWELSEWDGILVKGTALIAGPVSALPYAFLHRTFQEFLVARYLMRRYLADGLDAPEVQEFLASKASDPEWHIVRLLLVELLTRHSLPDVQPPPDAQPLLSSLLKILLNTEQDPSGQMAVAAVELLLASYDTTAAQGARDRLRQAMRNLEVKPLTRIHATRLLAEVGDPRSEVMDVDAIEFVDVPAGAFWMGSDGAVDAEATRDEFPLHRRSTRPFAISCYPISNAQYRVFLQDKDDGFDNSAYWTEAIALGLWRDGLVLRTRPRYRADGTMVLESVWAREPDQSGWPADLPNCPIFGISWYEARAFVRWLEKRWQSRGLIDVRTRLDLPSETEWEKAARGTDARIYPWGNHFDGNRLNWYGHMLMAPAPIGAFPDSKSPFGAEETVGNLWEWTRSVFTAYEIDNKTGESHGVDFEHKVAPDVNVAIRGGAYFSARARCRCAARSATLPNGRIHATFRIVKYPV